jgi:hypothetical protein
MEAITGEAIEVPPKPLQLLGEPVQGAEPEDV